MKWMTTIQKIGVEAISNNENMVILFNETANEKLSRVAVIQKFDKETPVSSFICKKDDTVTIDGETYIVLHVGRMVADNMHAIGHCVLFFVDKLPEKTLHNAIYLQKDDEEPMPQFKQGDWISYEHR